MAKLYLFISLGLAFLFPALLHAQTADAASLFNQGTQQYLAKEYKKAQEFFTQSLDKDPGNSIVLTNLAFAEFQLGNKPLAIGLLRKALTGKPDLEVAKQGLKFINSQLQVKDIPRQVELFESLRTKLLMPAPLYSFLVLSAISLFASGWVLLSYIGRRKKADEEEKTTPPFPLIGALLTLTFLIFTTLSVLKIYDASILRGTIIEEKISLQTAPGDNQVSILDLYGGMEVIVRESQGEWVQVSYPGSLTGWIKKSALLMTH